MAQRYTDRNHLRNNIGRASNNNRVLYDYRAVLTVYNILNALDSQFKMRDNKPTPAGKSPPPTAANWSPDKSEGPKAKRIYVNDNLKNLDRLILCFAEFLGTGLLVLLGCMGCVVAMSPNGIPHLQISFTFGLAVMFAVQCFGHISGCHINPAVTIGSVILGHTPVMHLPLYFAGQMLGGVAGFGFLVAFSPKGTLDAPNNSSVGVCSPGPLGPNLAAWQGAGIEFILTFALVFICAAIWDCRNTNKHDSLSIRLGLAVAVLAMAGGPYTGANLNPARSFGPALWNGDWDNWWVWWVGPLLGGVGAGVLYRFAFSKENSVIDHTPTEVLRLNDKS